MQLLVESTCDNLEFLNENTASGKALYIEGPFLMADAVNRNGRNYRQSVMEKMVDGYQEQYIRERRAIGEVNHPDYPIPNIERAALITQSLDWQGSNVNGKARILNNPDGDRIRSLVEAGFNLGVSSRALGTVTKKQGFMDVNEDAVLNAIDAVDMPSGQVCYVNALTESVNWTLNESGIYVKEGIDEQRIITNLREAHADPNIGQALMKRLERLSECLDR